MADDKNPRVVTLNELALHCKKTDAWISLKGKVYDVTAYVPEHPGGEAPITKGFGKDATDLFNKVHSYVDFEKILKGHEIGILETAVETNNKSSSEKAKKSLKDDKSTSESSSCCCKKKSRKKGLPITEFYDSPDSILYVVTFPRGHSTELDWTIGIIDKSTLIVRKFTSKSDVWVAQLELTETLVDDTIKYEYAKDFNSLELAINKPGTKVKQWKKIGTPIENHDKIVDSRSTNDSYDACIVYKQKLTPNTYLFGIRLKPCSSFGLPIGFHTQIFLDDIKKPYTPVCYSMMGGHFPHCGGGSGQILWYIIKIYKDGALTSKLNDLPVTREENPTYTLKLGSPQGSFPLEFLLDRKVEVILLMAGGTGITPMTRIIAFYIEKVLRAENSKHVLLLYWNSTEGDIIWKDKWDELNSKESSWFHFFPILTQPGPQWSGRVGHVTTLQIQEIIDTLPFQISNSDSKQGYICGSHGFNTAVEEAIRGIISLENTHIFAG